MEGPGRGIPSRDSTGRRALQIKQLRIFSHYLLQSVLIFNHRLNQIGFNDACMISIPDLDLAANSFVLRKETTWNREQ
jgi:hypothetical protein